MSPSLHQLSQKMIEIEVPDFGLELPYNTYIAGMEALRALGSPQQLSFLKLELAEMIIDQIFDKSNTLFFFGFRRRREFHSFLPGILDLAGVLRGVSVFYLTGLLLPVSCSGLSYSDYWQSRNPLRS